MKMWELIKLQEQAVREAVLIRDGYTCQLCGAIKTLTVHHIKPKCHGGQFVQENLITACRDCHDQKLAGKPI